MNMRFRSTFSLQYGQVCFFPTMHQPRIQNSWNLKIRLSDLDRQTYGKKKNTKTISIVTRRHKFATKRSVAVARIHVVTSQLKGALDDSLIAVRCFYSVVTDCAYTGL